MEMKQKRVNVRYLTQVALLIALQFVMKLTGLSAIPVGPLNMTFSVVPIAVGAILLGPLAGGILGMVYGSMSFYDAMAGKSAMMTAFFSVSPLKTFVLCVCMRILVGVCAGWIFRLVHMIDRKERFCYWIGALITPMLNTAFFMGFIVATFYKTDFVQQKVGELGITNPLMYVFLTAGMQAVVEAGVCMAVGGAVTKGVSVALGLGRRKKDAVADADNVSNNELL